MGQININDVEEPALAWTAIAAFCADNVGRNRSHLPPEVLIVRKLGHRQMAQSLCVPVLPNGRKAGGNSYWQAFIGPTPHPSVRFLRCGADHLDFCNHLWRSMIGENQRARLKVIIPAFPVADLKPLFAIGIEIHQLMDRFVPEFVELHWSHFTVV